MKKLLLCAMCCLSSLIALEPPLKKQKVTEQDFFEYLPAEIKEHVAAVFAREERIEDGVSSLLSLMKTNRTWYEFLNDARVTNTLIQIISQKYQVCVVVAAAQLGTPGAESWLEARMQQQRFSTTVMLKSALLYELRRGEIDKIFNRRTILWLLTHNAEFDPDHIAHLENGNSACITTQSDGEYLLIIFSRTGDEIARVVLPNTKKVKYISAKLAANAQHIIVTIFSSESIVSSYIASFNLDGTFNESFGTRGISSLDIPIIHEREIYELLSVSIHTGGTITLSATDDIDQPVTLFFDSHGTLDTTTEGGAVTFADIDEQHQLNADSFRSIREKDYLITSGIEQTTKQLYIGRTILNQEHLTNFFTMTRPYIRQSTLNYGEYALLATSRTHVVVHACYESNKSHHELKIASFNARNGESNYASFTRWSNQWTDTTSLYKELYRSNDLESSVMAIERWIKSNKIISTMISQDPTHIKWLTAILVERDQLFPQSMPESDGIREALVYASIPQAQNLLATVPDNVAQEVLRHTLADLTTKKINGKSQHYYQANRAIIKKLIADKKSIGPNFDTDHSHQLFLPSDTGFGLRAFSSGEEPISISNYANARPNVRFGSKGLVLVPKVAQDYRATALYFDDRSQLITLAGSHSNSVLIAQINASNGKLQRGPTIFQIADTKPRIEGITSINNGMLLLWGRTFFFGKEHLILIKVSNQGIYQTYELIPLDTLLKE